VTNLRFERAFTRQASQAPYPIDSRAQGLPHAHLGNQVHENGRQRVKSALTAIEVGSAATGRTR